MKKLTPVILLSILFSLPTFANVEYIHTWKAGDVNKSRTAINLTNVCSDTTIDATLTIFKSDGSLLANQNLNGSDSTDSNGQIQLNIASKNSATLALGAWSTIFTASGHAEIETSETSGSESNENIKCLIGDYIVFTTVTNNPYDGLGYAHLINQGERF